MTRHERTGTRDLTYSRWHRTLPDFCTYIDIDAVEYCDSCKRPLAFLEIAFDTGRFKPATITRETAKMAGIPAACVLYRTNDRKEITDFRVRTIWPQQGKDIHMTVERYAAWIVSLHKRCICGVWDGLAA